MGEFGTPIEAADFGDPHPLSSGIFEFPQQGQIRANKRTQKRLGEAAKAGQQKQLKMLANEFIKASRMCRMCDKLRPIIRIMLSILFVIVC